MNSKNTTKLFGTDGIRGEAGKFPLDSPTIRTIGSSLAQQLSERAGRRVPRIITGRDTRESSAWIEQDLIAGARAGGAEIQSAGVITTPGVAFLARVLPAEAGIVISASHNPYYDNGIKVFDPSGRKLDEAAERRIENDVLAAFSEGFIDPSVDSAVSSVASDDRNAATLRMRYLDYLEHDVAHDISLIGFTIVVDCANGAAYELAPELFTGLGARVVAINNTPDGRNINLNCGSLHIEGLQGRVIAEGADLGVAFDGDADRALFVDAAGNFVDGDATMWVLANYLKSRGKLTKEIVIATVMSNVGLEVALRSRDIKLVRTDVGDKNVVEELLRCGATIGGEQSGHIIFPELSIAGDGLITTILLLRVMRDENKTLNKLTEGFQRYPQVLINEPVREKKPFEKILAVQELARRVEHQLGDRGRLLLRYSGTEPLARIMIEGETESEINGYARQLAEAIRAELGSEVC